MKRLAFVLGVAMSLTLNLFAQKDLIYSGGNCVSSMVCDNGNVFVMGKNKAGSSYGLLGTSNKSSEKLTEMTKVDYFETNSIQIRQVSSGSGSHFVALDCKGNVWCWGNNSLGQCGNLTSASKVQDRILDTPTKVLIGNNGPSSSTKGLKGTEYEDPTTHTLRNVDVVYAGNNSTFAILGGTTYKGCLVAWGGNEVGFDPDGYDNCYGQLGCGNTTNQPNPVFVLTPDGKPLQNVIQVFAGDNSAYALVDDGTPNDGIGTVYSWGYQKGNGSLGRAKTGGVGSSGDDFNDPYARPVKLADGSNLTNITMLGCGDGVGYGLDTDGYIWSWGNSAWNNSGGIMDQNTGWLGANSSPLRVRAGYVTGAGSDGTYLLAKYVSGGQGFGMAITVDNKPVSWGGNTTLNNGTGGIIGNGYNVEGDWSKQVNGVYVRFANYIQYEAGKSHDDVVLINRGDTWGFYGRADGTVWAWGDNAWGQAGFGSSPTVSVYAKRVTLDPDCAPHAQDPAVSLNYSDFTVCASAWNGADLDAGFIMNDVTKSSYYNVTWKKDDVVVKEGTVSEHADVLSVTETGKYDVSIEYQGPNSGCYVYEPAVGSVTIGAYPQTFTIPEFTYACGAQVDSLEVYVNAASGSKAVY
ncbi:MAG: hypothetical protein J6X43_10140 [Bacteroidales bacterium]|nr:hypothetical protein [Bacteroidales bacterium]